MNTIKARVRWFNKYDGCGGITGLDGGNGHLYACNIKGKKTWYPETACVYFEAGDIIDVYVDEDTGIIVCETQGKFDQEKWDSLDHDQLAFTCNEDGEATTGLFA